MGITYITSWWSDTTSALGKLLAFWILDVHLFTMIKSFFYMTIWGLPWPLSDVFLCGNRAFAMKRLLAEQKLGSLSPLLFISPYPCCPITWLHWFQPLPTFAFITTDTIKMSCFGVSSIVFASDDEIHQSILLCPPCWEYKELYMYKEWWNQTIFQHTPILHHTLFIQHVQ